MQGLRQDIRYAVRTLVKAPVFTLIAVVTLALGIGANTAIFTLVNGLLLKPLPFAHPDELMMVHLLRPDRDGGPGVFREMVWSYPKYEIFRDEQQVFSEHALFARTGMEPDRQRRAGTRARRDHRRALPDDAGRDATHRPRLHQRRRPHSRDGRHRHARPRALAATLRRRPERARPGRPPERGAVHRRRRAAARLPRPDRRCRGLDPADDDDRPTR